MTAIGERYEPTAIDVPSQHRKMDIVWSHETETDIDGNTIWFWEGTATGLRARLDHELNHKGQFVWVLTITKHPEGRADTHELGEWRNIEEACRHAEEVIGDPNFDHATLEGIEHLDIDSRHQVITAFAVMERQYAIDEDSPEYHGAALDYFHTLTANGLNPTDDLHVLVRAQERDI